MSLWKPETAALAYKGTWNATTNTPTLGNNGVGGDQNDQYIVSTAGTTSLDGIASWNIGDWVINTGSVWTRVPTSGVVSVAGRTGVVALANTDISGLGTASVQNVGYFATASQGAKADTALQVAPVTKVAGKTGDVTLSQADVSGTATSAQGTKADNSAATIVTYGTVVTHSDAEFVHLAGAETISGIKTHTDNIVMPMSSGKGFLVNPASPQYGWKDLLGPLQPSSSNPTAPTLRTYRGGAIQLYAFGAGDDVYFQFHIPHDYAPGTDMYIHVHWSHNGTAISGNFVGTWNYSYCKGYNQAGSIFSAEKTVTCTYATVNIATTPQYCHRIEEVQLSSNGGSATLLDSSIIEVDGLLLVRYTQTTLPSISGGSTAEVFIPYIDLHYQSTQMSTKGRNFPFYT